MAAVKVSKKKKLILLIGAAALIVITLVSMMAARKREKPIAVTTDKAFRKTITQLVTATGKIQPEVEVKIAPEVSGEIIEYGGCSEVTGAIAAARFKWSTLKFETPIQRTLPSALSCARVVQPSSTCSSGSGQWIW